MTRPLRIGLSSVLLCFLLTSLVAQGDNRVCKELTFEGKEIILDSLQIDPASLRLWMEDSLVQSYTFSFATKSLVFPDNFPKGQAIQVCYRHLSMDLTTPLFHRSLHAYDSNAVFKDLSRAQEDPALFQRQELFRSSGINKNGMISRQISVGNNQNLFVNSTMNFQMDGQISDNLFLEASVTDQRVPYQPEGTTRQIQEMDRVLVRVYNDQFELLGGDIQLHGNQSKFLHYYKNVSGGQISYNYDIAGSEARTTLGASVAKGKFASIQVDAIEGVQGPYRLTIPDGPRFIMVMANSEKVYLDGRPLERGFNQDYVIDYNLGEVTFTNKVLITQFSRIRVDFEYADQNYSRSITTLDHEQRYGKLGLRLQYYQEKDNPNRPLSFDLSDQDKLALSMAPDSLPFAFVQGYDTATFHSEQIFYIQKDTLYNGMNFMVFEHARREQPEVFRVSFADVGEGKGNYRQKNSLSNGRVYEWVAPVNGIPQGRFEPGRIIEAPNQQQMFTTSLDYSINEYEEVYTELAFNHHDRNLFNPDNADQGHAWVFGVRGKNRPLGQNPKGYKLSHDISLEHTSEDFRFIDRVRHVEFDRDWSLVNGAQGSLRPAQDQIFNAQAEIKKDHFNRFSYRLVHRDRQQQVKGYQHHLHAAQNLGLFHFKAKAFHMNNDLTPLAANWNRLEGETFINGPIVPGYRYLLDKNLVTHLPSDSVIQSAMYFEEHTFYLRSQDSLNNRFKVHYTHRNDKMPYEGMMSIENHSQTLGADYHARITPQQSLHLNGAFRMNRWEGLSEAHAFQDEATFQGRLDYQGSFWNRLIRTQFTYTAGTGRELKREYTFIRVNPGEGTHTWRDDNGDGVQDIDEFYEAVNPDERNYAKIFVPTDEYIKAFHNALNYQLQTAFPSSWKEGGWLQKGLSKLSSNTNLRMEQKITDEDLWSRFLPGGFEVNDDDLVSSQAQLRSTFFYNRNNPVYGLDGGLIQNSRKQLLVNGMESRSRQDWFLNGRWNLWQAYQIQVRTLSGQIGNWSDFLTGRNFLIQNRQFFPELSWQPGMHLRLRGHLRLSKKWEDSFEELHQESLTQEMGMGIRYNRSGKGSWQSQIRYAHIAFEGEANSAVGYELLEALQPGNNLSWTLRWEQRLPSGLQLSLQYEGRKSEAVRTIHTGSMQVTALF